ncbi:MAG: hypothetical protein SVV80_05480 [Planctomycetota bacterium]|nr:hypothetical protein [Planctomycetota bacterium]
MIDCRTFRGQAIHSKVAFTLIEVLTTLTLAAIVLPAVVDGILLSLATAGHARRQSEAVSLAQSKLAELVAGGQFHNSELTGDFGPDWPEYRWSAQVNTWEDTPLLQLDVSVNWTHRGKQRSVTLTTLIYEGAPSE